MLSRFKTEVGKQGRRETSLEVAYILEQRREFGVTIVMVCVTKGSYFLYTTSTYSN